MLMAEMAMDGALSGAEETKQNIIRISERVGGGKAADFERKRDKGKIRISAKIRRQILGYAIGEGNRWVDDLEHTCRKVLGNALATKTAGNPIAQTAIAKQLQEAILDDIEPAQTAAAFAAPAKKLPKKAKVLLAKSKAAYRKAQTDRKWKKQLAKAKTGKQRKVLKRRRKSLLDTAWNRQYNQMVVVRSNENPEVVYLQFTLGRAKNHTDQCLARQGMVARKDDPRWAENTPPLHWDCRSTLIPVTRDAAKRYGIKRNTPRAMRSKKNAPAIGFALTR